MRRRLRRQLEELDRELQRTRLRADEAQMRAEMLAGVIDQVPVGVLVLDPGGSEVAANPWAVSTTEAVGTSLLVQTAVRELAEQARRAGEGLTREVTLHDPPARSFALSAVPLASGVVAAFIEDVSERNRLAAMRRDFTVNASHELRTPIGALVLLAEALTAERDPETVGRLAPRILDEAERAHHLLEGILDLSRVEAEGVMAAGAPVELPPLVEDAVGGLAPLAEHQGVRVRTVLEPGVTVVGNREQLLSAVVNLVDNAIKYSSPGAEVEVAVCRESDAAVVAVRDHGAGIPSRDLDRIFERFYRVDRGRGRRTGGSGLGLAIVRHVAENHGGDVIVESVEGSGSLFRLRLPMRP